MSFDQLLVVQTHDTAIDQLTHKRATLPEREQAVQIAETITAVDGEIAGVTEQRHAVAREQKRFEDEAALVEAKKGSENEKLYSGSVTAMKELQMLQEEIASLGRRQNDLEDNVIEQMELGEPLDAELESLGAKREAAAAQLLQTEQKIAELEVQLDGEIETHTSERAAAAGSLSSELMDLYETARRDCGGVGVARLTGNLCEGCHLTLAAVEVDRLKKEPADKVAYCDSCSRILVR